VTVWLPGENVLRELRPGGNARVRAWYATVSTDAPLSTMRRILCKVPQTGIPTMAFVLARPALTQPLATLLLLLFIGLRLVTGAEISMPRANCDMTSQHLLDGYGGEVLDGFSRPIVLRHESECKIIINDLELPLGKWTVGD
jgi:hypothetical protein